MINAKKYFITGIAFFAFGCSLVKDSNLVETTHSSKKVVVLAIDGGGIKGIIPAIFLQSIEASLGKPSYQLFDVIGGTSTGGIISSALTSLKPKKPTPYSANDIVNIYKNQGDNIFVAQNCKIEFCATYYADNKKGGGVEPYLQKMLGISTSLSDSYQSIRRLPNARVSQMFTTSYIVNSHGKVVNSPILGKDYGPYLFNWQDAIKTPNTHNYYIWEAARATSAAPTYFPIAHTGGGAGSRSLMPEKWVIDGGTMSNDPAVWGVTEALRTGIATKLEDIVVISLGTGVYPGAAGVGVHNNAVGNNPYDGNWSTTPWMVEKLYDLEGAAHSRGVLMSIVLDAVQLVSNSQLVAMQSAGLQYYRLEPALTLAQSQMDNISNTNIQSLMSTAENYLQSKQGAEILKNIISELKKQQ